MIVLYSTYNHRVEELEKKGRFILEIFFIYTKFFLEQRLLFLIRGGRRISLSINPSSPKHPDAGEGEAVGEALTGKRKIKKAYFSALVC